MAGFYYYFIASLPSLSFGQEPPFSSGDFLAQSRQWLPETDWHTLIAAAENRETVARHKAGARWWQWETALRNSLATARASRLGRDPAQYLRGADDADSYVRASVQEFVKLDDPLKAEQALDKLRWSFLDELCVMHSFDFHVAFSYILKLKILERWAALSDEQGRQTLAGSIEQHGQTSAEQQ